MQQSGIMEKRQAAIIGHRSAARGERTRALSARGRISCRDPAGAVCTAGNRILRIVATGAPDLQTFLSSKAAKKYLDSGGVAGTAVLSDEQAAEAMADPDIGRAYDQLHGQMLVEHARMRNGGKRGGKLQKMYLEETKERAQERDPDLVELDDGLQSFASTYPRESEVVELKFFGGLEALEIAAALHVSIKTVSRDWTFAKLWLCNELTARSTIA